MVLVKWLQQTFWKHVPHKCQFREVRNKQVTAVIGVKCRRCGCAVWFNAKE